MIAAAAVAIAGRQVIFARGKTLETVRIAVTKDGEKQTVTINCDVKYALSGATSTLIQTVMAAFGKK